MIGNASVHNLFKSNISVTCNEVNTVEPGYNDISSPFHDVITEFDSLYPQPSGINTHKCTCQAPSAHSFDI